MFIDMESFTATEIVIDNQFMLLELNKPDVCEYYVYNTDGTLTFVFGTEDPMTSEGIERLYMNGYFDDFFH